MDAIDILTVLSTLICLILSTVDDFWNKSRIGKERKNIKKFLTIAIALIAFSSAVWQVRQKNIETNNADELKRIAYSEINLETLRIMEAFVFYLTNEQVKEHGTFKQKDCIALIFRCSKNYGSFDSLLVANHESVSHVNILDSVNRKLGINTIPELEPRIGNVFSERFLQARQNLNMIISKYGKYVPEKTLISINNLINCPFYRTITIMVPEIPSFHSRQSSQPGRSALWFNFYNEELLKYLSEIRREVENSTNSFY